MESCDRCVKLTTKVESLTAQNKKILELLKVLNAAKKHKEQLIDSTLEFIKSKDEDYKKEKIKIKELAIRVKTTTTESVLRNVPKQIDECSALYIQKSTELQNYAQAVEMARVAKMELETKTLELDGNRMYVKQLIADAAQEREKNKLLNGSLANGKLVASKASAKQKKLEKECAMLTNVHSYQTKVEAGVKRALKKLEANEPNSTKSCLRILHNLVSFFTSGPLFEKRIKKESGENSKDVARNDSPHSISSGYSSGAGSPWTTPYNTPQQSEQINTKFTCSFTPEGNFVLFPAPLPPQSTSANTCATNMISTASTSTDKSGTSSGSTPNQYSITSPRVTTSVFSPPRPIKTEPAAAASEVPASSWSMGCDDSSDDDNDAGTDGTDHQNETDTDDNKCDKEPTSREDEALTNKQKISDKVIENTLNRDTIKMRKIEISSEKSTNKSVEHDPIGHAVSQNTLESHKYGTDKAEKTEITCEKQASAPIEGSKLLQVDGKMEAKTDTPANSNSFDADMEPVDISSKDQDLSKCDDDTESDSEHEEVVQRLAKASGVCTDEILQLPDIGVDNDCDSKPKVNKKKDVEMELKKDKIMETSSGLDKQETKRLAMFGTKSEKKTQPSKPKLNRQRKPKSQPLDSQRSKKKTKKEIEDELVKAAKLLEENLFEDALSEKEETPVENSKISNHSVSFDAVHECTENTTKLDNTREEKDVGFSVANGFHSCSLSDDESVDLENDDEDNSRIEKSVMTVGETKASPCSKKTDGKINDSIGSENCLKTSADANLKGIQATKQKNPIKSINSENEPTKSDTSPKTRGIDLPVAKGPPKRHSLRNLDKSPKSSDKKPVTRRPTRKSNNSKQTSEESDDGDEKPLALRLRRKTCTPQKTCENKSQETPVKRQSSRRKTTRNSSKLDSSLDEDIGASISKDLETSLSDNESITVENVKGGCATNNSSMILDKDVKTDDTINTANTPHKSQHTFEEKKETSKMPATRQSKRKSSNCQDSCNEKSGSDANEPRLRRQPTRNRSNSKKICYENPESDNDQDISDDEKPVKRQSLRTRKTEQSCDAEKSTGRYSLRKIDNTPKKKEVTGNEEKKPGRPPSLKRKTTRNTSIVDKSVAETAIQDGASDDTEMNNTRSLVDNTSPIVVDEIKVNKSSMIKDKFMEAEGEISTETKAEGDEIEESVDSESVLSEDVMQIFKDMEVMKNITIVENLTASPCRKRKVESSTTNIPLSELSESSDDTPLSKLSESSDSDHIVPNGVESNENNANLELEEDNSDIDKPNDQSVRDSLRIVKVPNHFESHVDDNSCPELEEDTSEINKSNVQTEDVLSSEIFETEDPLKIVKNEIISQQEMNKNRIENDKDRIQNGKDTRLMDSKTKENGVPDTDESNDGNFKTSLGAKASQNLCSLNKFNNISKSILSKPVVFVSSAATKAHNVKDELLDTSKDVTASSNCKEPTIVENKFKHPNINSKPIEKMRNRHIPIHCALDHNSLQPDPTQRNKGIQRLIPNHVKSESTVNTETRKSEVSQNESILSPTPMNVEANGVPNRTRKSRVAHPNKKIQHSSLTEKSIESKNSELISPIKSKELISPIKSKEIISPIKSKVVTMQPRLH
uniref:Uncharacterized protein n=2 Tax=Cacopsylla melanoneura TaxID=428564 RepID=A0A8D8XQP9_9HEMI